MNKINITNQLLVSLKNAYSNKNKYAYCKVNKLCLDILWTLYKEGLIADFKIDTIENKVKIKLKYIKTKPLLSNLQLISKPKLKCFATFNKLHFFNQKFDYFFFYIYWHEKSMIWFWLEFTEKEDAFFWKNKLMKNQ